jgi:hypothetical protein
LYVGSVTNAINGLFKSQVASLVPKRNLLNAMVESFGAPHEFDADNFSFISFLFLHGRKKEPVFVTFTLPPQYPKTAPSISLSAFHILKSSRPSERIVQHMDWNATWDAKNAVKNIQYVIECCILTGCILHVYLCLCLCLCVCLLSRIDLVIVSPIHFSRAHLFILASLPVCLSPCRPASLYTRTFTGTLSLVSCHSLFSSSNHELSTAGAVLLPFFHAVHACHHTTIFLLLLCVCVCVFFFFFFFGLLLFMYVCLLACLLFLVWCVGVCTCVYVLCMRVL